MRLQLPQMRCRVEYGPRVAPEKNDSLRSWAENLIRAALWEVQMNKVIEDQKQKTTAFRPVTIIRRGTETIRREG
jgi:hypothetical protein